MAQKAPLLTTVALVALFLACGGGEEKAAFDRYESSVEDLLEREARLRDRYQDMVEDIVAYQDETGFNDLIEEELVPFYDRMREEVGRVRPEGEQLARIHAHLVGYAGHRARMFGAFLDLDRRVKAGGPREAPATAALEASTRARAARAGQVNEVFASRPALMQKVGPLFHGDAEFTAEIFQKLESMRRGMLPAADFIRYVDESAKPFLDELEAAFERLDLGEGGVVALAAVKNYLDAQRDVAAAARQVAVVREELEAEVRPLKELFESSQREAEQAWEAYTSEARAWRDSLR